MLDFSDVDSNLKFEGLFPVKVLTLESKTSQAGNKFLQVTFEVLGKSFAGIKMKEVFVWNTDFGKKKFANLLDAVNVSRKLESYSEIHAKICMARVEKNKDDQYSSIKEFELMSEEAKKELPSSDPADDLPL